MIIEPTVEEDGLIMYTCYCGEQKTESLPKLSGDYHITYDAGEGSGAPLPQGKAKGKAMIISPVVPTRDGFDFLGWALTQDTEQPEYLAGGEFNKDADTTLYAVWRRQTIPLTEIAVERSYISLLPGESCDFAFSPIPANASDYTVSADGWNTEIIECSGSTVKALAPGETLIRLYSGDIETFITVSVAPEDHIPGDVNGDGEVDTRDLARLVRRISGAELPTIFADVNDDGSLDTRDLVRLMRFLSGNDVAVK